MPWTFPPTVSFVFPISGSACRSNLIIPLTFAMLSSMVPYAKRCFLMLHKIYNWWLSGVLNSFYSNDESKLLDKCCLQYVAFNFGGQKQVYRFNIQRKFYNLHTSASSAYPLTWKTKHICTCQCSSHWSLENLQLMLIVSSVTLDQISNWISSHTWGYYYNQECLRARKSLVW